VYSFSYVVKLQSFAELEEALDYQRAQSEQRTAIKALWTKRLEGAPYEPSVWLNALQVGVWCYVRWGFSI
jgi:hypothetical protein